MTRRGGSVSDVDRSGDITEELLRRLAALERSGHTHTVLSNGRLAVPTLDTTAALVAQTAAAGEVELFQAAVTPADDRLYEIHVVVGAVQKNTGDGTVTIRVKIGATTYGVWFLGMNAGFGSSVNMISLPTTLPAGPQVVVVTVATDTDTVTAANTGNPGSILVLDIGPA